MKTPENYTRKISENPIKKSAPSSLPKNITGAPEPTRTSTAPEASTPSSIMKAAKDMSGTDLMSKMPIFNKAIENCSGQRAITNVTRRHPPSVTKKEIEGIDVYIVKDNEKDGPVHG